MHNAFLDTQADTQWLKETHLKGIPLPSKYANFQCAVLQGNEDAPCAVNLYIAQSPDITDNYFRIVFENDPPVYAIGAEFNGATDKPL